MKKNIYKTLIEIKKSCQLKLNKKNKDFQLFNGYKNIEEIEGIKIAKRIKYFGLAVYNNKKLLQRT